ncbi:Uncharacterised protein [uncultured archaeon]|nr:Uncharacterised protein [uncultured archaeon]
MNPDESIQLALQELKRADHSISVSLKYTRTVDVIKSIIERLINTIGFGLDALVEHAKSQKKISEASALPKVKVDQVKMLYASDKVITDFCDFYLMLRKIDKAKFSRAQEYRRHVTMTAQLEGGTVEITIDIISDYFEKTKDFLNYVSRLIHGEGGNL